MHKGAINRLRDLFHLSDMLTLKENTSVIGCSFKTKSIKGVKVIHGFEMLLMIISNFRGINCIKAVGVASVTSAVGLWMAILNHQVLYVHFLFRCVHSSVYIMNVEY